MSKWILTLDGNCDLAKLSKALSRLGVNWDQSRQPVPLDEGERAITVSVLSRALPDQVSALEGVVRVSPASKMSLFRG